MGKLEDEHQKRLKELHEHHQNEQFALYEKNVQLHEKICQLENELQNKNESIELLQKTILEEGEVHIKFRALNAWRVISQQRKQEQHLGVIADRLRSINLTRTYFNKWRSIVKGKWKSKVERVCKDRATEVCLKLKDELTSEINRLKVEVTNRDKVISEMDQKQSNYEEGLSKALMRGVCALNMEAMSVLNNPDYADSRLPNDFIGMNYQLLPQLNCQIK
jgi:centrosomal protein POC5